MQSSNVTSQLKVWEFGDTFILILRGKPIDFLHIYHHAMTELLTWSAPAPSAQQAKRDFKLTGHSSHDAPPLPPPSTVFRNQLREASAVAWVPIILNLAVHVLMYVPPFPQRVFVTLCPCTSTSPSRCSTAVPGGASC